MFAEAANPEWTSVPLLGWSHSRALALRFSAQLVTQVRNRDALLRAGLAEERDFVAIDSERLAAPVCKISNLLRGGQGKGWTTATAFASISYSFFEHLVWRRFQKSLRGGEFDLVHRITPQSPTAPSSLARKCRRIGVPFVLGPLNVGLPWPKGFGESRRSEREWLSYVRAAHKLLPGYRATRASASAILIGSVATWNQMPRRYRDRCIYIPENGIDCERFHKQRIRRTSVPLRGVFVGRLVPYKGADMLLRAAAPLIRKAALELTIIGDGPQRKILEAIVSEEGIESGVHFSGWLQHFEIQDCLIEADLFLFPSIREFGGAVVIEAMAVGLVPVVVGYGGPAEFVTPHTGFIVELGDREQIIERLRAILHHLALHPDAIENRSGPARRRALELFSWRAKTEQVSQVYDWVLGNRPDKPNFGMPFPDLP